MAAAVDDGWEDSWQMTASGDGGSWEWQAMGGNVEQWWTMAAAARGVAADDGGTAIDRRQTMTLLS
jgi:hypothetical protein